MKNKTIRRLGLSTVPVLLLVSGMAGCSSDGTAANEASPAGATVAATQPPLTDSKWDLTGATIDDVVDRRITLEFKGEKVSGFSGVNRYMGSFESPAPGEMKFGPLASTMMAGPDDAMAAEAAYLAELAKVTGYRLEADKLILVADSGDVLTYTKAS
ncbi:MAG: META domain-containing protein [Candidatus Nanopelagicales bacterium]